jgi:sirohydrochlorin cobaltochelatase
MHPQSVELQGIILLAHGAKDPLWSRPFEAVRDVMVAADPTRPVVLSYLESMAPSLAEGAQQLVRKSCVAVEVVPLFLGQGGHVRKDIPAIMQSLIAAHPQVRWRLHPPVGEHPAMVEAMARVSMDLAGKA